MTEKDRLINQHDFVAGVRRKAATPGSRNTDRKHARRSYSNGALIFHPDSPSGRALAHPLDIYALDSHTLTRFAAPRTGIIEECRKSTPLGAPQLLTMCRRRSRCLRESRLGGGDTGTPPPPQSFRSPSR